MKFRIAAAALLIACSGGAPQGDQNAKKGPPAFPVEIMTVARRPVEYTVRAVGGVEAYEEVRATARVAGVVERIDFMEGRRVKAGDVLAVIEPQRFRTSVASARAMYKRAEAAMKDAESAFRRRDELAKSSPDLVREEELMNFRTKFELAEADFEQAKAALDLAALNLRDAHVRAPVSGVIQSRTVQTGQYVQAGTVIATLLRERPLLLRFDVAEREAERLKAQGSVRFETTSGTHEAVIRHIGGSADPQSRMVPVVAEVVQPAADLRPGAFADVRVLVGGDEAAMIVPQIAVRPTEQGLIAFVVEGDVARRRIVTGGMRTPDGGLEVLDGLKPGEKLVIRGADALREGVTVRVAERPAGESRALPVDDQAGRPVTGAAQ